MSDTTMAQLSMVLAVLSMVLALATVHYARVTVKARARAEAAREEVRQIRQARADRIYGDGAVIVPLPPLPPS